MRSGTSHHYRIPVTGAELPSSFQILPGVKVIIAHTETKGPLGDSHLGEVSAA